jgi:hypothetical protein
MLNSPAVEAGEALNAKKTFDWNSFLISPQSQVKVDVQV